MINYITKYMIMHLNAKGKKRKYKNEIKHKIELEKWKIKLHEKWIKEAQNRIRNLEEQLNENQE